MNVSHEGAVRPPAGRTVAVLASAAVLAGLACTPVAAQEDGATYTIELQARSNLLVNDEGWNVPPGTSFNSITPDLNDAGQVAFRVQMVGKEGNPFEHTPGLWFGGNGTGSIVHRLAEHQMLLDDVALNEAGDIAFTVSDGDIDSKLALYEAATGEARVLNPAPIFANGFSNPGIDEEGNVGFQAKTTGGRAYGAVVGGQGTLFAADSGIDPASPWGWFYTPRYNDAGQIAAKVGLSSNISRDVEIRVFEAGGTSERVLATNTVDPASPYRTIDNSIGFSDNGWVAAVVTEVDDDDKIVVRTNGTVVEELAEEGEDGIVAIDYFAPDINNDGTVVFRGSDADGQAVFVADGDQITKVAGKGDEVETDLGTAQLGQHDASPVFGGAPRINNHGDVSFTAGLHPAGDNTEEWGSGVFVAHLGDGDPEPPVNAPPVVEDLTVSTHDGTDVQFTVEASDPDGDELTFTHTQPAAGTISGDGPDFTYSPDGVGTFTAEVTVSDGELTDTATVTLEVAATGPVSVERLAGGDRYVTAAKAALATYDAGVPVVYVASGLDYPDALTAAALAGHQDGPVLLTRVGALPRATVSALEQLQPERVVLVGGEVAVSQAVEDALADLTDGTVTRVHGKDRYRTAAALAREFGQADTVYVATGQDYADALAAAARAGAEGAPVLLVRSNGIPAATAGALTALSPSRIVVAGGEVAVSPAVLTALGAYADTVERVAGQDRYVTAALLTRDLESTEYAYVATGQQWPDALASAALAGHRGAPVLLARADALPQATVTALERLEPEHLRAVGGPVVLEESVIDELEALDYTD